jgi:hypothetical protein
MTGGRWYPSNAADHAVAEAMRDGRASYTLAYSSLASENSEKYHTIRVTTRRKGVHLQARDGFYGEPSRPQPDEMEEASFNAARRSPMDATEIGLRVTASRNVTSKTIRLRIHVNPADVLLQPDNSRHVGHLSFMVASYSEGFLKQASAPARVDLNFTQDQLDDAVKEGITLSQDVPNSEEIQKLRVIVFDRVLYSIGSVTIPNLK